MRLWSAACQVSGEFQLHLKKISVARTSSGSIHSPASDNLLELLMMTMRLAAFGRFIVAVIPYFDMHARTAKTKPRVSIASKLVAKLLSAAGVNRIITLDLHADQIQGIFWCACWPPVMLLPSLFPLPENPSLENLTFASPEHRRYSSCRVLAKYFQHRFRDLYKHRSKPNEIAKMALVGDCEKRNVILLDDIVDTGGTLCKAAQIIMENGAKSVRAWWRIHTFRGTPLNFSKLRLSPNSSWPTPAD